MAMEDLVGIRPRLMLQIDGVNFLGSNQPLSAQVHGRDAAGNYRAYTVGGNQMVAAGASFIWREWLHPSLERLERVDLIGTWTYQAICSEDLACIRCGVLECEHIGKAQPEVEQTEPPPPPAPEQIEAALPRVQMGPTPPSDARVVHHPGQPCICQSGMRARRCPVHGDRPGAFNVELKPGHELSVRVWDHNGAIQCCAQMTNSTDKTLQVILFDGQESQPILVDARLASSPVTRGK